MEKNISTISFSVRGIEWPPNTYNNHSLCEKTEPPPSARNTHPLCKRNRVVSKGLLSSESWYFLFSFWLLLHLWAWWREQEIMLASISGWREFEDGKLSIENSWVNFGIVIWYTERDGLILEWLCKMCKSKRTKKWTSCRYKYLLILIETLVVSGILSVQWD